MTSNDDLISPQLRVRLHSTGFIEAAPAAPKAAPRRSSFAPRPTRAISNNKLPTRRAQTATPASTRATPVSASPTARAEKLICDLAQTENDRAALSQVLDALIEDLAETAEPLRALLNFSRLCDALSHRADFFRELQNDASLRARLCRLLSFSQALSDSLIRDPSQLQLLRDGAMPRSRAALRKAARAAMNAVSTGEENENALGTNESASARDQQESRASNRAEISGAEDTKSENETARGAEKLFRADGDASASTRDESSDAEDAESESEEMRGGEILSVADDAAKAKSESDSASTRGEKLRDENAMLAGLRAFRRRETLRIGLLDMESATWRDEADFNVVVRQISDLAQVCVDETLRVLARHRGLENAPFCVFGMGKLGARELNYSSDIDLIFIHDGDDAQMQSLGEALLKSLGEAGENGALFRVDMRLRPDGTAGPLTTPIGYALSYYESYAAAWEWQAMIKIRGIAGDAKLARRFRKFMRGVTWAKRGDDAHLREMLAMKRRMETRAEGTDERNVKQGPGSIRDAEWVVQQLQMMVGPSHPKARVPATLNATRALTDLHALTHDEARRLRDGYLFLRVLEHRLQLWQEQPVRNIPEDEAARAALARRIGISARGAVAARQLDEEHARHRRDVRALCERVFWAWREEIEETENPIGSEYSLLSPEAQTRLSRIAEGTPSQPLPAPLSRQIRAALPDALQHLSGAADPERALKNLENLCEASGNRLSMLRTLGAGEELSRAVFAILGGSQRLSDTLFQFPQLLDMATQRSLLSQPRSADEARSACRDYCLAFRDRMAALRRWRDREILRIGLRDLVMNAPPQEITREIADLAGACLAFSCDEVRAARRPRSEDAAFFVIGMGKLGGGEMHYASDADVMFGAQSLLVESRLSQPKNASTRAAEPRGNAKIKNAQQETSLSDAAKPDASTRAGAEHANAESVGAESESAQREREREIGTGESQSSLSEKAAREKETVESQSSQLGAVQNDASTREARARDIEIAALSEATAQAEDVMKFCGERTEDGIAFEIDARLRPDGASSPLVRSIESFLEYFERETNGIAVWERQALTRARIVAGDFGIAARLMAAIRHVAFPENWQAEWGDELRHIKARVENERAAKGAKSGDTFDVKLGPGALSDIEFCAQWLAMKHGARVLALQTPSTLAQIEAARAAALLSEEEAAALRETYVFLRRAELRLQITQEGAVKGVKRDSKEFAAWARAVFPGDDNAAAHFVETWDASTRGARLVMERVRDEL